MSAPELLRAVKTPMFAKCMGDVKHVTLGDNLCPDCEIISEAEYVKGCIDRFTQATSEAHARLSADLEPCGRAVSPPKRETEQ